MAVSFKTFKSETGFSSPGFSTDTAGNVDFTGSIRSNGVTLLTPTSLATGITTSSLTTVGTLTSLNVDGAASFLSTSGAATFNVNLNGRRITVSSTGSIQLLYGNASIAISNTEKISITSGTVVGSIDNMKIGETTPSTGKFTDLVVTGTFSVGTQTYLTSYPSSQGKIDNYSIGSLAAGPARFSVLTVTSGLTLTPGSVGVIDNVNIGLAVPGNAAFLSATVSSAPSQATQITNKQYVDSKVSAFAIALGS